MRTEEIRKDANNGNWQSELAYDQWLALPVSGSWPSARYKVFLKLSFQNESSFWTTKFSCRSCSFVLYFVPSVLIKFSLAVCKSTTMIFLAEITLFTDRPNANHAICLFALQHAAAVVDEKLYVVGGSRNGRFLSDVQVSTGFSTRK